MSALDALDASLCATFGEGRRWLVATDVLQAWGMYAAPFARWGAGRCVVLGARRGTGPEPDPAVADALCLDLPPAADLSRAIHEALDALAAPPAAIVAALDALDPGRSLRVLGDIFSDGRAVAGRVPFGARPAAVRALEDKPTIDALWDATGVPRAPTMVVPAQRGALTEAARALDRGDGTVWAGDARDGFHGGASLTRWVRDADDAERAAAALATRCDVVRVMPFLEGIPCSIHGIVLPDGVIALRPMEMLVLRRGRDFVYARAASFWDPPEADREAMRAMVRRVGEHLAATLAYRGAFTIDGVLTERGFRPTELNPRVGAALSMVGSGVPFPLWNLALIEGVSSGASAGALEAELLATADRQRHGSFSLTVDRPLPSLTLPLCWTGEAWREAGDGETVDATMTSGPGATGGYANVRVAPERVPVGPSFAPRVAAFGAFVDARFALAVAPLTPAPSVR